MLRQDYKAYSRMEINFIQFDVILSVINFTIS